MNVYYCQWDEDLYEIYIHKKLKYSIFRNGEQVAGIDQDRWNSFEEDGFRMECNNDVHKEFFIALTLILDSMHSKKVKFLNGLFTYKLGALMEAKEYNSEWKSA